MRFWDTSAIVPLLVAEARTAVSERLLRSDPGMFVWWATEVECASALARLERSGELGSDETRTALRRLETLRGGWNEVAPTVAVKQAASRLLRGNPVRAADALQLAAAVVASENSPASLPFVTLDDRLGEAAEREGFTTLPNDY